MGYKPSPRPTFSEPTPIRAEGAVQHVWGDEEAGLVQDWIYVSSERIHAISRSASHSGQTIVSSFLRSS